MKSTLFSLLLLSTPFLGFADHCIYPAKYPDQKEVLVQGGIILISEKTNSASIYQTCEAIENRKANFYFEIFNKEERPINFYFQDLQVTDQNGRPIRIVPKQELIANKQSQANWKLFASTLCEGIDTLNAEEAGRIDYYSHSSTRHRSQRSVFGSEGWAQSNTHAATTTTTHGVVYSEALRRQAIREAQEDAHIRNTVILGDAAAWETNLRQNYFDSSTIAPDSIYGANIQIDIPRQIEKELEYLVFTVNVGEEAHSFCFYCSRH